MDIFGPVKNAFLSMGKKSVDESLVIPLEGRSDQDDDADRGKQRFYGFRLNQLHLLLDTDTRREVINDVVVTPIPLMPSHILGLCNVRGRLVPVFDMYQKLGLEKPASSTARKKILLLDENENMAGIEIHDMVIPLKFDEQDIQRDVDSNYELLNQCISYSYQQDGTHWFGFDCQKLFKLMH